jgi:hypothetical protein
MKLAIILATGISLLSSTAFAGDLLGLNVDLGVGGRNDRVIERNYFVNPAPMYTAPVYNNAPCYTCATTVFIPPPQRYEYYEWGYNY